MIKLFFHRDDDPQLPDGEKSIFNSFGESVEMEYMQDQRMEDGCLEAHIYLYYQLHIDRCIDEMGLASYRFLRGECQECGSVDGYREETQRCATCQT